MFMYQFAKTNVRRRRTPQNTLQQKSPLRFWMKTKPEANSKRYPNSTQAPAEPSIVYNGTRKSGSFQQAFQFKKLLLTIISFQPTKPPLSKSKDRLLVAKMSDLAKVSSGGGRRCHEGNDIERIAFSDCSEC